MTLYNEETIEKTIAGAWAAYRKAEQLIDFLEDAGLAVDGSSSEDKPMGKLFGILTDAGSVILAAMGVPDEQPYSDEAYMVLSHRGPKSADGRLPDGIRRALADIADTAYKKSTLPMAENARPHEVTVCLTGGITAYASGTDDAMERVSGMATGDVLRCADWEASVSATDAYEN